MAVITSTAIAGTALTAATVSTGLAVAGLAVSAGTATASFVQAGKQRKKQTEAEEAAAKAMESAKQELSVNYAEGLSIQKEGYELERDALLQGGAQAVQAAREGGRGSAEAIGRVALAQQAGQAGQRVAMGKELFDLDKLAAEEDSKLARKRATIDQATATGAQMMAADARAAANASNNAGFQQVGNLAKQGLGMVGLYGQSDSVTLPNSGAVIDTNALDNQINQNLLNEPSIFENTAGLGADARFFRNPNNPLNAVVGERYNT